MTPRWSFPEPKDPEIGDLFRVPWFTAGWWLVSQPTPKRYKGWKTPAFIKGNHWLMNPENKPLFGGGGLLGRVGWLEMNCILGSRKEADGVPS